MLNKLQQFYGRNLSICYMLSVFKKIFPSNVPVLYLLGKLREVLGMEAIAQRGRRQRETDRKCIFPCFWFFAVHLEDMNTCTSRRRPFPLLSLGSWVSYCPGWPSISDTCLFNSEAICLVSLLFWEYYI